MSKMSPEGMNIRGALRLEVEPSADQTDVGTNAIMEKEPMQELEQAMRW